MGIKEKTKRFRLEWAWRKCVQRQLKLRDEYREEMNKEKAIQEALEQKMGALNETN